jgi:hypothetical protein
VETGDSCAGGQHRLFHPWHQVQTLLLSHFTKVTLSTVIYTVKKVIFFRPHLGCHKPKSPWLGIIQVIQLCMFSDIPAGDGKSDNLFYTV